MTFTVIWVPEVTGWDSCLPMFGTVCIPTKGDRIMWIWQWNQSTNSTCGSTVMMPRSKPRARSLRIAWRPSAP